MRVALPSFLGPEVKLDLVSLGPGGEPIDSAGRSPAFRGSRRPPSLGDDGLVLRRLSASPTDEGAHWYESDVVVAIADLRAARGYTRTPAENAANAPGACVRCDRVALGIPRRGARDPLRRDDPRPLSAGAGRAAGADLRRRGAARRRADDALGALGDGALAAAGAGTQRLRRLGRRRPGDAPPLRRVHLRRGRSRGRRASGTSTSPSPAAIATRRSAPGRSARAGTSATACACAPSPTATSSSTTAAAGASSSRRQSDDSLKSPTGVFAELFETPQGYVLVDPAHTTVRFDAWGRLVVDRRRREGPRDDRQRDAVRVRPRLAPRARRRRARARLRSRLRRRRAAQDGHRLRRPDGALRVRRRGAPRAGDLAGDHRRRVDLPARPHDRVRVRREPAAGAEGLAAALATRDNLVAVHDARAQPR